MMCDYNSHTYINIESNFISLSKKYCEYLKESFLDTMILKYTKIFKKLLLLNEWSYLISSFKLIEWDQVKLLRKFINDV